MRSVRRLRRPALRRSVLSAAMLAAGAVAVAAPTGPAGAATAPTTLRTDGIGPLKLGMSRSAAVRTGWLSNRGTGCPLGGRPYPITYAVKGKKAPGGLRGTVEFDGGKLRVLTFTKGVRTTSGVTIGTRTATMVSRSEAAGFSASTERSETFGGTFVLVRKGSADVLGGFASGSGTRVAVLGVPRIPVCE